LIATVGEVDCNSTAVPTAVAVVVVVVVLVVVVVWAVLVLLRVNLLASREESNTKMMTQTSSANELNDDKYVLR
jgi:uncharacterized membrane protein